MDWSFIEANYLLIGLALASGGMLLWSFVNESGGGNKVNVTDATLLINRHDAQVLDVREPDEFASGHIVSARNLPVSKINDRLGEIHKLKEKPLILCCASGIRASKAASVLKKNGFTALHVLNNGVNAWKEAGLPLQKGRR